MGERMSDADFEKADGPMLLAEAKRARDSERELADALILARFELGCCRDGNVKWEEIVKTLGVVGEALAKAGVK